jgi:hypothetical protein
MKKAKKRKIHGILGNVYKKKRRKHDEDVAEFHEKGRLRIPGMLEFLRFIGPLGFVKN